MFICLLCCCSLCLSLSLVDDPSIIRRRDNFQRGQCRDWIWAVLFIVHLITVLVIGLRYAYIYRGEIGQNSGKTKKDNNNHNNNNQIQFDIDRTLFIHEKLIIISFENFD